jgi:hypothetical protein
MPVTTIDILKYKHQFAMQIKSSEYYNQTSILKYCLV